MQLMDNYTFHGSKVKKWDELIHIKREGLLLLKDNPRVWSQVTLIIKSWQVNRTPSEVLLFRKWDCSNHNSSLTKPWAMVEKAIAREFILNLPTDKTPGMIMTLHACNIIVLLSVWGILSVAPLGLHHFTPLNPTLLWLRHIYANVAHDCFPYPCQFVQYSTLDVNEEPQIINSHTKPFLIHFPKYSHLYLHSNICPKNG